MNGLRDLQTADQALIDRRRLLTRVDTKFLLRSRDLHTLMERLAARDYAVMRHESEASLQYRNLYFDTPGRALLRDHHRGRRPRHKVRIRHHMSRQLSFFEVKRKRPNDTTVKMRTSMPFQSMHLDAAARATLRNHRNVYADDLEAVMSIDFARTMLVGIETPERISIDVQLRFSESSRQETMPSAVVIEVKQARFHARSPAMLALRSSGAIPLRFSKYLTGAYLLWPSIRLSRYTSRMRRLRRYIDS